MTRRQTRWPSVGRRNEICFCAPLSSRDRTRTASPRSWASNGARIAAATGLVGTDSLGRLSAGLHHVLHPKFVGELQRLRPDAREMSLQRRALGSRLPYLQESEAR